MRQHKAHIPAPGRASGLQGFALCGRWAHYRTGDHDQIRRQAQPVPGRAYGHYCTECLRRLRRGQVVA